MTSLHKVCPECGVPIGVGLARCQACGAQVGTLFSETESAGEAEGPRHRKAVTTQISQYQQVEKAQERANNSLVLALASFFCPGIGFAMGTFAVVTGVLALRTLKEQGIEEGRGLATAGVVTGVIGLTAQVCYLIYAINMGIPFIG